MHNPKRKHTQNNMQGTLSWGCQPRTIPGSALTVGNCPKPKENVQASTQPAGLFKNQIGLRTLGNCSVIARSCVNK